MASSSPTTTILEPPLPPGRAGGPAALAAGESDGGSAGDGEGGTGLGEELGEGLGDSDGEGDARRAGAGAGRAGGPVRTIGGWARTDGDGAEGDCWLG
ncbi:MAG TPA: hypothetical protein VII47_09200, partial [Actinomycetota bacterium]